MVAQGPEGGGPEGEQEAGEEGGPTNNLKRRPAVKGKKIIGRYGARTSPRQTYPRQTKPRQTIPRQTYPRQDIS